MADNFIESGDRIKESPPAQAYTKGVLYLLGDVAGVALDTYATTDADAVFAKAGVYTLAFDGADTAAKGKPAYWDAANEELKDDGEGGTYPQVGTFHEASTGTTAQVDLNSHLGTVAEANILAIDDTDSPYTLADMERDTVLQVDTQTDVVTVNLPPAADNRGRELTVIRMGTGVNAVTIDGDGAETINGATTHTGLDAEYDVLELVSTGTEWLITNSTIA